MDRGIWSNKNKEILGVGPYQREVLIHLSQPLIADIRILNTQILPRSRS